MVNFSNLQHLNDVKKRLARIEHGDLLGFDHPRHYTAEERAREIARINAEIARVESGVS